jgi:hypothetical protein
VIRDVAIKPRAVDAAPAQAGWDAPINKFVVATNYVMMELGTLHAFTTDVWSERAGGRPDPHHAPAGTGEPWSRSSA